MDNLRNMLSKSPAPGSASHPSHSSPESEQSICVKLPNQLVEYIRDLQYREAVETGNLHFSFKDAISSIIANHKSNHPEVTARPNILKEAERKTGRRK